MKLTKINTKDKNISEIDDEDINTLDVVEFHVAKTYNEPFPRRSFSIQDNEERTNSSFSIYRYSKLL